jgi:hypothetical protein
MALRASILERVSTPVCWPWCSETAGSNVAGLTKTLSEWTQEIVRMWRCTRNNDITAGFHRKMKLWSWRPQGESTAQDAKTDTK